jgi:hypothetical protein
MMQPRTRRQGAATQIRDHLARHPSTLSSGQTPDTAAIETIIEAAFWASLRREEGYVPRISLAFIAPETVKSPLTFERRLPLAAQPLTRLAPAAERPGIHLGVWRDSDGFFVWGATRTGRRRAWCSVVAPACWWSAQPRRIREVRKRLLCRATKSKSSMSSRPSCPIARTC